jgi:2-polyprenyl-3-methyl-5-hydroxy-6-metoxy-1,4-benzoquinol methylase
MRQALPRLKGITVKKKNPDYIHLYFLMRDIKEALDKYAKKNLLDLGCGNKPYKEWYASLTASSIGCDAVQSSENVVDTLCLASALPYKNDSFETVFSTQVLEHVFEQQQMINEAARVLKQDGYLILSVPFTWELHEEPYDFFRITKYGLKEMFEKSGFEIDYIKANGGKWAAMFQMMINTVYSTFKYKTIKAKILKIIFLELKLTWLINKFAIWVDKRHFDDSWTLNYVIVAKKK